MHFCWFYYEICNYGIDYDGDSYIDCDDYDCDDGYVCEDGECVVYEERDKMKYMRLLVTYIENFLTTQLQLHGKWIY